MPLLNTSGNVTADAYGGGVAAVPNYIEECFSTFLYTGNGSTQTITNGINVSGKGGLVWFKNRSAVASHYLFDTARGNDFTLASNETFGQGSGYSAAFNFASTGFTLAGDEGFNTNANTYASWTFRKQPKFFDVVTFTANPASSPATVAHNLGSVPGCIMVKRTDNTSDWFVSHRSAPTSYAGTMYLNTTAAAIPNDGTIENVTSTSFGINVYGAAGTQTYVAYLFAHNAGGFGLTGTDNVISCGSYTGNGSSTGPVITLGYEPQWLLVKRATGGTNNWLLMDTMRGFSLSQVNWLYPNLSDAELNAGVPCRPTATGFSITATSTFVNANTETYIYIAIRRGPMKVPTSGTSVFAPVTRSGTNANTTSTAGFPVDWGMTGARTGNVVKFANVARLIGNPVMFTSSTNAEVTSTLTYQANPFDNNTALKIGSTSAATNASGDTFVDYMFRRAPSFFDEVCYTANGTTQTITHNLGVAPELLIIKQRSSTLGGASNYWVVVGTLLGNGNSLGLNRTDAINTVATYADTFTNTSFTVYSSGYVNYPNGSTLVAYLFATCPGVSKVGSYTGTGATQTISCGFTGGAKFVLIKRTDSTGDWYVWDTARGMVSGTDPSLLLNSTAAEVNANSIYTTTGGFQIVSTAADINASGGSYIFFAVA